MIVPHLAARFGTDVLYLPVQRRSAREKMVDRFQSGDAHPCSSYRSRRRNRAQPHGREPLIHLTDGGTLPSRTKPPTALPIDSAQRPGSQFIGSGTLEEDRHHARREGRACEPDSPGW